MMRAGAPCPTVTEWVLPRRDVEAWFKAAAVGRRFVYAHGERVMEGETKLYVRQLVLDGLADPHQPRAGDGLFDFMLAKRASPIEDSRADRGEGDPALDAILRELRRCANLKLRAPTNTELARRAGLATADQAAWRVRKLVAAAQIRTDVIVCPEDPNWRIVTIVETKKRTLLPPSYEQANRDARREKAR